MKAVITEIIQNLRGFLPNKIPVYLIAIISLAFAPISAPVTQAVTNNPYSVKLHASEKKEALFILSPDISSEAEKQSSRRSFDIFRQITTSYWPLNVTTMEINEYKSGQANNFDVIVIVDEYGEELPWILVEDIIGLSGKEVVHFGLGGDRIMNLLALTQAMPNQGPFRLANATYKGVSLTSGSSEPDIQYGIVQPFQPPAGVTFDAPITAYDKTGRAMPAAYRLTSNQNRQQRSGYLFFPFSTPRFYDTQSYTNAILDVLHDPFGDMPNYPKQALVRLEDVNASTYASPDNPFFQAYTLLQQKKAPFHVALIERYIDPKRDIDASTADHRHFNYWLHEMVALNDAVLVQHGYTHQYKDETSAIGYEFWDFKNKKPAENDSPEYARERIESAQTAMRDNKLPVPDIWETPHYARGPNADKVVNEYYPLRYEEILGVGHLPFPVSIDGTIYIPETLGYIEKGWDKEFPAFQQRLEQLQVFRNANASFFWHPWRDTQELDTLVSLLQGQGYQFVHAYDLVENNATANNEPFYMQFANSFLYNNNYFIVNIGVFLLYMFLLFGFANYIYDRIRFRKYFKLTTRFRTRLSQVKRLYTKQDKELPTFEIFVPARNEGLVIANTIDNLASLDYPKVNYQIIIITDRRERDDGVDILTKDEVKRMAKKLNKRYGCTLVKCMDVPDDYSGIYGDNSHYREKSTKGRALNYALQKHKTPKRWKGVNFIGILDADGRLNKHILKEVACEIIENDAKILQGPVYQVSNLSKVTIVGMMAGLELARFHLANMMPRLLNPHKVQFLAGTNYFIRRDLIQDVNGWDQHAMVEDAELALRVYTKDRTIAHALTLPEVEQTPENFKVYRKQRERWARGHFDMLGVIMKAPIPLSTKFMFYRKIVMSQFRFIFDLCIPIISIVFIILGYFQDVALWMQIASVVLVISILLMWDVYGQTYRRLLPYSDVRHGRIRQLFTSMKLFVFMPAFMIIQAIPRIDALYRYATGKTTEWSKTQRTAEEPIH